jgi:hypothetical protein
MAVTKSDLVTNADDLDTMNDQGAFASEKLIIAHELTAGAVADNDVILMCEVPVNAKISSIRMFSDDLGTTGDLNLGFYPGPGSGVAIASDADAVDEDAIGTAIDVNAAALANVEVRFETKNISTANQKAWELAGLSSEPDYGSFYLAFTASEATTAAGDIVLHVRLSQ